MDGPDSLEDWVAVKENPFSVVSPDRRLRFHVAWNHEASQLAITSKSSSRKVTDKVCDANSGLFSVDDVHFAHNELCLIYPQLEPCLPQLPRQQYGIMSFFASVELDVDDLCRKVARFLDIAVEICGQKMVIATLFEHENEEEYFESMSELNRKRFDDDINNCEDELNNVIFLRDNSISMVDISSVYQTEDECIARLNVALASLYNYQLQPFLDLREVAYQKIREAKQKLSDENLGERVSREYANQFSDWQSHYSRALDMIEETYVSYYTKTSSVVQNAYERILNDQTMFGKTAFLISGQERLERLGQELSMEKQQLLKSRKRLMENQRDRIKYEIASLDESPKTEIAAQKLEKKCYDKQNEIFALHLELLDEEDNLVKLKIAKIKRHHHEKENDIVFYDAVEDVDEIDEENEDDTETKIDPELSQLSQERVLINRKRAAVRNRKRALQSRFNKNLQKKEEVVKTHQQHHGVQIKRDQEAEVKRTKQSQYDDERRKTLLRLREYRMKYNPPRPVKRRSVLGNKTQDLSSKGPKSLMVTNSRMAVPGSGMNSMPYSPNVPPPPPPPSSAPPPPPPPPPSAPAPPPPPPVPSAPKLPTGVQVKPPRPLQERPKPKPPSGEDAVSNMMEMIRRGVKLRSAESRDAPPARPSENHTNYLHEVLKRIGKSTCAESDAESDADSDFE